MNSSKQILRYYWSHLRKFKLELGGTLALLPIIMIGGNYVSPLILAGVINKLSKHQYVHGQIWPSFGPYIVFYVILSIANGLIFWRLFDSFFWRLEGKVEKSIAEDVFSKLSNQTADFHANQFSGSLVSNTSKLMNSYIRLADTTLFQVSPLVLGLIFVGIVMSHRAPLYTLVLLVVSASYIITALFVTKKLRHLSGKQARAESRQTGRLADTLSNVMAVKSFAAEGYEFQRFHTATTKTYKALMDCLKAFQFQSYFLNGVASVLSSLSLLAAIIGVVVYNANLATAFLIFNYTAGIIGQLFMFSNSALRNYNRSFGDASSMIEILNMEPSIKDPVNPQKLEVKAGEIKFSHVTFGHDGANESIFEEFNLVIKPGEKIGLVGHSGAGKSTLTRLILRFSDLDSGQILIDGQDISKVSQSDLRSVIAYVPQEPILFHRSLAENVSYGRPGASLKQIKQAALKAHADEFINVLPQGYDTLVGERGVKLSGGQRQRVVIARAILKQAPIILLDEATSALDSDSEKLIQDALWQLMAGKTAVVIAHRLSTIQRMDRIVVLEDGVIAEEGSHKELLAKNGIYAKLWEHQSGGFLED